MGPHIARHLLRVGPRVLPQRPPDRLADEEVAVGQVRLDVRVEQVEVRLALELQLADDRNPALPEVGIGAPRPHERPQLLWMSLQQVANHHRELIDVVPPRAGDDHLFEHRHQPRPDAVAMTLHRQEKDGRVALFAVAGAAP